MNTRGTVGAPRFLPARTGEQAGGGNDMDLMERVVARGNMTRALKRVQKNAGAPGSDGMEIKALLPYLQEHWATI
ncbi:MAG: hypothetical protein GXX09_05620 [Syntrophomonadaceae bacterium]|nr:hypothetical protein [Syntrophomonadaceae bacterium]